MDYCIVTSTYPTRFVGVTMQVHGILDLHFTYNHGEASPMTKEMSWSVLTSLIRSALGCKVVDRDEYLILSVIGT